MPHRSWGTRLFALCKSLTPCACLSRKTWLKGKHIQKCIPLFPWCWSGNNQCQQRPPFTESQNHEMVWVGRDLQRASSSNHPDMGRDTFHQVVSLLNTPILAFPHQKKRQSWFVESVFSPEIHLGLLSSAFATPPLLHPICASSPFSLVSLINLYCTSKHRLEARVISNLHSLVSIDML